MIDYNEIDAYELADAFESWLDMEHPGQENYKVSRDLIQFIKDQGTD